MGSAIYIWQASRWKARSQVVVGKTEAEAKKLLKEMRREADRMQEEMFEINVTMEKHYEKWPLENSFLLPHCAPKLLVRYRQLLPPNLLYPNAT